jgi:hypothetical protein
LAESKAFSTSKVKSGREPGMFLMLAAWQPLEEQNDVKFNKKNADVSQSRKGVIIFVEMRG